MTELLCRLFGRYVIQGKVKHWASRLKEKWLRPLAPRQSVIKLAVSLCKKSAVFNGCVAYSYHFITFLYSSAIEINCIKASFLREHLRFLH